MEMFNVCFINSRGREDQRKFFSAWKVLKVCSKKYIKNYLFFRNDLFHHEQCTNITMILRTCGHFGHFLPCFSLHPQSLLRSCRHKRLYAIHFVVVLHFYTVPLRICFRKLTNFRRNCVYYLGMMIALS